MGSGISAALINVGAAAGWHDSDLKMTRKQSCELVVVKDHIEYICIVRFYIMCIDYYRCV